MAFTGITATENDINYKMGANVSVAFTDVMKTQILLQAESYVNALTKYNWSDSWGGLNVDVKYLVTEATSNIVAIYGIKYDMFSFVNLEEAESMINILWARTEKVLALLEKQDVKSFVSGA